VDSRAHETNLLVTGRDNARVKREIKVFLRESEKFFSDVNAKHGVRGKRTRRPVSGKVGATERRLLT
jgi:hypothetical protein